MHEKIEWATAQDRARLQALHAACFEDTKEYISFYYQNRPPQHRTAILRAEGEVVAMLTAISFEIQQERGTYLYAVGTHPQHRGKGYMRRLLEGVYSLLMREGVVFCLLVPANAEMEDTYRRMGFTEFMPLYRAFVTSGAEMKMTPLSYEEFARQHRKWTEKQSNAVCWPDEVLRYQYDEMCGLGGGAVSYIIDGEQYYAAYTRNGNAVYMLEDSGPDPFATAAAVATSEGVETAQIRTGAPCGQASRYPPAMGRSLVGELTYTGYASFLLDV